MHVICPCVQILFQTPTKTNITHSALASTSGARWQQVFWCDTTVPPRLEAQRGPRHCTSSRILGFRPPPLHEEVQLWVHLSTFGDVENPVSERNGGMNEELRGDPLHDSTETKIKIGIARGTKRYIA